MSRDRVIFSRREYIVELERLSTGGAKIAAEIRLDAELERCLGIWSAYCNPPIDGAAPSYDIGLLATNINKTSDAILSHLISDPALSLHQRGKMGEFLVKFQKGGQLRNYLLGKLGSGIFSPANKRPLFFLLKEITEYAQRLSTASFEDKIKCLGIFPHALSDGELNCEIGTRDRLVGALKSLAKFDDWRSSIILSAHERVIEEYNVAALREHGYDPHSVHSKVGVEHSVGKEDKANSFFYYFKISDDLVWKNYINYVRDVNKEIKGLVEEIYGAEIAKNKDKIIKFLKTHPMSSSTGRALKYDELRNAYYEDAGGTFRRLTVNPINGELEDAGALIKVKEEDLREVRKEYYYETEVEGSTQRRYVAKPVPAHEALSEYIATLGLPMPDMEELATDYSTRWKRESDLQTSGCFEAAFCGVIKVEDALLDPDLEVEAEEERKGEVVELNEKIAADGADPENKGRLISEDIRNPSIPQQIAKLIRSEKRGTAVPTLELSSNMAKIEAAVWALYTISRNIATNNDQGFLFLSKKLHFVNCIIALGFEPGKELDMETKYDEVFQKGLGWLELLKSRIGNDPKIALATLERAAKSIIDKNEKSLVIDEDEKRQFVKRIVDLGVLKGEDFKPNIGVAFDYNAILSETRKRIDSLKDTVARFEKCDFADKLDTVLVRAKGLRELVNKGAGISIPDPSIFLLAVRQNNLKLVAQILADPESALPTLLTGLGSNPIFIAARDNNVAMLKLLLPRFNAQEASSDGRTPLMLAAECGSHDAIRFLIDKAQVETETRDHKNKTALYLAAFYGKPESVRVLLEKRADVNARCVGGETSLYVASSKNHVEVIKLLLAHKDCDVDANFLRGRSFNSPIVTAVANNFLTATKTLLAGGARVDILRGLHSLSTDPDIIRELAKYKGLREDVENALLCLRRNAGERLLDKVTLRHSPKEGFSGLTKKYYRHLVSTYPVHLIKTFAGLEAEDVAKAIPTVCQGITYYSKLLKPKVAIITDDKLKEELGELLFYAIAKSIVTNARRRKGEGKFDMITTEHKEFLQKTTYLLRKQIKGFVAIHGIESLTPERISATTRAISKKLNPIKAASFKKEFYRIEEGDLEAVITKSFSLEYYSAAPDFLDPVSVSRQVWYPPHFIEENIEFIKLTADLKGSRESILQQAIDKKLVEIIPQAHDGLVEEYSEIRFNGRTYYAHEYTEKGVTRYLVLGEERGSKELMDQINKNLGGAGQKNWANQIFAFGDACDSRARSAFSASLVTGSPLFARSDKSFGFAMQVDKKDILFASEYDMFTVPYNKSGDLAPRSVIESYNKAHGIPKLSRDIAKEDLEEWAKSQIREQESSGRTKHFGTFGAITTDPHKILDKDADKSFVNEHNEALVSFNGNKNPIKLILPLRANGVYSEQILTRARALADFLRQTGNEVEIVEYGGRNGQFLPRQYFLTSIADLAAARKGVQNVLTDFTKKSEILFTPGIAQFKKDVDDAYHYAVLTYGGNCAKGLALLTKKELHEIIPEKDRINTKNCHHALKECTKLVDNLMPYAIAKGIMLNVRRGLVGESEQKITKVLGNQIKQFIAEHGAEALTSENIATAKDAITQVITLRRYDISSLGFDNLLRDAISISFPIEDQALADLKSAIVPVTPLVSERRSVVHGVPSFDTGFEAPVPEVIPQREILEDDGTGTGIGRYPPLPAVTTIPVVLREFAPADPVATGGAENFPPPSAPAYIPSSVVEPKFVQEYYTRNGKLIFSFNNGDLSKAMGFDYDSAEEELTKYKDMIAAVAVTEVLRQEQGKIANLAGKEIIRLILDEEHGSIMELFDNLKMLYQSDGKQEVIDLIMRIARITHEIAVEYNGFSSNQGKEGEILESIKKKIEDLPIEILGQALTVKEIFEIGSLISVEFQEAAKKLNRYSGRIDSRVGEDGKPVGFRFKRSEWDDIVNGLEGGLTGISQTGVVSYR